MKKSPNAVDAHVGARVRMRRLMLDMSQSDLGGALGVTFQQVQKYEKGTNRISASRLAQVSHVLQVPIPLFFDGLPSAKTNSKNYRDAPEPSYITKFLATADGLSLTVAFTKIKKSSLRRSIVDLVEQVAGGEK